MHRYHSLLLSLFTVLLLSSCSPIGTSNPDSPKAVMQVFEKAMAEQRLDDAAPFMSPEFQRHLLSTCGASTLTECSRKLYREQGKLHYNIQASYINPDNKKAAVTIRAWREKVTIPVCLLYVLEQRDDRWVILSYQAEVCQ